MFKFTRQKKYFVVSVFFSFFIFRLDTSVFRRLVMSVDCHGASTMCVLCRRAMMKGRAIIVKIIPFFYIVAGTLVKRMSDRMTYLGLDVTAAPVIASGLYRFSIPVLPCADDCRCRRSGNTAAPSCNGQCCRAYSTASSPTPCGKTRQEPVTGLTDSIIIGG